VARFFAKQFLKIIFENKKQRDLQTGTNMFQLVQIQFNETAVQSKSNQPMNWHALSLVGFLTHGYYVWYICLTELLITIEYQYSINFFNKVIVYLHFNKTLYWSVYLTTLHYYKNSFNNSRKIKSKSILDF
jgi:hypothetical protein